MSKRISIDGGDRVGNNGILAAAFQHITFSLDDGIAIASGIIIWVSAVNSDARQTAAAAKNAKAERRDGTGDIYTRQTAAVIKCVVTDACNGVGNRHARQATAAMKS